MNDFVHLSTHSEYSLVDSVVFLNQLAPAVKERGMSAVALTDKHSLTAMLKFQHACFDAGIKPIIGCDLTLLEGQGEFRLLALAANQDGHRNLIRLITEAARNPACRNRITRDMLVAHNEGLMLLSGGVTGDIGQCLLAADEANAEKHLDWYLDTFEDRFYATVTRTGRVGENAYIESVVPLAERKGVPLVATNDVICIAKEDFALHDAKLCIQRKERMDGAYSWHGQFSSFQHLRTPSEMAAQFEDLPDAVENAAEIAKRCNVEIKTGTYYQRPFPTSDTAENERILRTTIQQKLKEFLEDEQSDIAEEEYETYRERATYELGVIIDMGFAGYFLIVQAIVDWAREEGIPVGPGRGSGAASLVAMLLGITSLDPIKYKLYFERLLNPDRRSMPDLDIDFCARSRDRVMQHVVERFGEECVGLIATQGTHAAKGILHGMGRAMGIPHSDVSRITKLIPTKPGTKLAEACEADPAIAETAAALDCTELLQEAMKLEGIVAIEGVHPAGLVIAPGRLDEYVPCKVDDNTNLLVTQLDKDDVEQVGMVKFDLLSLKNLTAINRATEAVNASPEGNRLDINAIPLDDEATFRLIAAADTEGVFQLESAAMKRLIRLLKPDQFADLVALVALIRPGPLSAKIDEHYAKRKRGLEPIRSAHPLLETVLSDTYGLMIYQEDVMSVARTLAGFSGGEADMLREAMGKKRSDKLVQLKDRFLQGCRENDVMPSTAAKIYDDMLGFSAYAFPRAHSTAYALVTYQTAYLKANHPNEYFAALISVERDDPKRIMRLLADADRCGLEIKPPDVNQPSADCIATDNGLRLGLLGLKNVGAEDVRAIEVGASSGEFANLLDFCKRVDLTRLQKTTLEHLIKAGALDKLETQSDKPELIRALLLDKLESAYQAGAQPNDSNLSLFGEPEEHDVFVNYRLPEPLTKDELCEFEDLVIGYAISRESMQKYFHEFRPICTYSLDDQPEAPSNEEIIVAGTIMNSDVRELADRGEFAKFVLQGPRGSLNVMLWPEQYEKFSRFVIDDQFVVAKGKIRIDRFRNEPQLNANALFNAAEARKQWQAYLVLKFPNDETRALLTQENLCKLEDLFAKVECKGGRPVDIRIQKKDAELRVNLGKGYRQLPVTDETLIELREIFSPSIVNVRFNRAAA